MSTKIYANARFGFREDTLENWTKNNPVLERGEPAVVRDGQDGEWLKIGDGVTRWKELPYKLGPKGDQGIQGPKGDKGEQGIQGIQGESGKNYVLTDKDKTEIADMVDIEVDQTYNPESENAQSGIAVAEALERVKVKKKIFTNGAVINAEDNTEYMASEEITTVTINYPETDFICSISFTIANEGDIFVTLPESKYIGGTPEFANGETWELNIKNGVVVGGLVE